MKDRKKLVGWHVCIVLVGRQSCMPRRAAMWVGHPGMPQQAAALPVDWRDGIVGRPSCMPQQAAALPVDWRGDMVGRPYCMPQQAAALPVDWRGDMVGHPGMPQQAAALPVDWRDGIVGRPSCMPQQAAALPVALAWWHCGPPVLYAAASRGTTGGQGAVLFAAEWWGIGAELLR